MSLSSIPNSPDFNVSTGIRRIETSSPDVVDWYDAEGGIYYNGVFYPYDSPFIPQFIIDEWEYSRKYL